jgi:hypothetical protein
MASLVQQAESVVLKKLSDAIDQHEKKVDTLLWRQIARSLEWYCSWGVSAEIWIYGHLQSY